MSRTSATLIKYDRLMFLVDLLMHAKTTFSYIEAIATGVKIPSLILKMNMNIEFGLTRLQMYAKNDASMFSHCGVIDKNGEFANNLS